MSVLCLQSINDDDVEIIDYQSNFKICTIQIKNSANYNVWQKQLQYLSHRPFEQKFNFGNQEEDIDIQIKGKQQHAELIVSDNKLVLKNKEQQHLIYQLMQRQIIQMEKVIRINQYSVNFDKKKKVIQLSNRLNSVHSIQLNQSKQNLMMDGTCLGVVYQTSDGEVQYQANSMQAYCKIQQNEEVELQNSQNFQLGNTQFYIQYSFS
ncbi:unnamed protein product (macronuclear) [Paramecium tetraurelia]|uniref:Uncharacterized protein n=1 Tax=Paramecium tetraurelia TaxID=5888 RepID=A0E4G2_PARTE|nr:uncharacterized protein GSPATT00023353001 [Paramecium tetraurelia]CAK90179.1 unnamed protein product [Paramecium tetraurelia]|eukprot:XP_001457576.1 hypothetical protein (macronuclear) [Paramecium tetraurelia strain d4-2]